MSFRVLWHPEIVDDFGKIHPIFVERIVEAANYRLSNAPQLIGHPLKGTTNLVWKMRFSDYRILYTINISAKEVWILSVEHRKSVYNGQNVMQIVQMALAIHQSGGNIKPPE